MVADRGEPQVRLAPRLAKSLTLGSLDCPRRRVRVQSWRKPVSSRKWNLSVEGWKVGGTKASVLSLPDCYAYGASCGSIIRI